MRRLAAFREREAHKREGSGRSWDFFAGERRRRPTTKSFSQLLTMAQAAWNKRWIKPEASYLNLFSLRLMVFFSVFFWFCFWAAPGDLFSLQS